MTEIIFYHDYEENLTGFEANGHSGFSKAGKDIVCASISVLTINFVNSVDELTESQIEVETNEKTGYMKVMVKDFRDEKVKLLFESLRLGLNSIQESYPKYLKLTNRRCKP